MFGSMTQRFPSGMTCPFPALTTAQRDALGPLREGTIIYNITEHTFQYMTQYGGWARFGQSLATTLLMHMDGTAGSTTFTDSSGNGNTFTANGSAQISTTQSKFGGASANFNGTNSYLTSTASAGGSYDLGALDFTIEFFAYSSVSGDQQLMGVWNSGNNCWQIHLQTSAVIFAANASNVVQANSMWTNNQWVHVAITRQGFAFRIFFNGVLQATGYSSVSITPPSGSNPLNIGRNADAGGVWFYNGYLDELRIVRGVALYTANFTPPSQAFVV